jgi:hypothetical protein
MLVVLAGVIPITDSPVMQPGIGIAKIAAPVAGAIISGSVQIAGTAVDPLLSQYELDYAPDPAISDDIWKPIQPPIAQQVQDGVLGAWDSTQSADGAYWIRLRVIRQDGTSIEDRVHVQVVNATPPPTATAFVPATVFTASVTPGPSPTSPIWQPPTRTPRPAMTPGGPTPTRQPFSSVDSPFRPERLNRAALDGVAIGIGVFVLLGLYSLLRITLRGELRSAWQQVWTEYLHPLLNSLRRRRG